MHWTDVGCEGKWWLIKKTLWHRYKYGMNARGSYLALYLFGNFPTGMAVFCIAFLHICRHLIWGLCIDIKHSFPSHGQVNFLLYIYSSCAPEARLFWSYLLQLSPKKSNEEQTNFALDSVMLSRLFQSQGPPKNIGRLGQKSQNQRPRVHRRPKLVSFELLL